MKKLLSLVLAILCCLTCVACLASCDGEKPEETKGESNNSDIYYVKSGNTKIALGADAKGIFEELGAAKSVSELGDCGGFGAQVKYVYDNFNIYTLKNDNGETIDQISFTSDLALTSKGICISSTKDAVISAYGEPTVQNEKELRYTTGQNVLKFGIDNGVVSSVDYIRISG